MKLHFYLELLIPTHLKEILLDCKAGRIKSWSEHFHETKALQKRLC